MAETAPKKMGRAEQKGLPGRQGYRLVTPTLRIRKVQPGMEPGRAEAQGRQIELADIYTRLAADGDEQTAAALTAAPEEAPDMEAVAEWIARRISRRQQRKIAQLQEKLNDASLGDAEKLELLGQIQSLQQKHD